MKICLINNLFGPYARGGAEIFVANLRSEMQFFGHEVCVIATRPLWSKSSTPKDGHSVYYLPSLYHRLPKMPKFLRFFWHIYSTFNFFIALRIKKILKVEKPDLVITNNLLGLSLFLPALIRALGLKHVHILHDIQLLHPSGLMILGQENIINTQLARIYQTICRFYFKSVKIVVSPSNWLIDLHQSKGFFTQAKKIAIFNPFKLSNTKAGAAGNSGSSFDFIYIGQLEKHKGLRLLLQAYRIFIENHGAGTRLFIIGDGSERCLVEKFAREIPAIKYLGVLKGLALEELREKAFCQIVPSVCHENSPTVIYEALSSGLPVIAARIGGIKELVTSFGGILFEPGVSVDLIKKMQWAIENPIALKNIAWRGQNKVKDFIRDPYLKRLLREIN